MKIEVYSNHFSVNTNSEFEKDICKRFAARFAEYSFRVPGFRGVKRMVRIYAASNKSRNQYRFHIHCLSDFKNACRFAGLDESKIEENTYALYDPPTVEYDLNPALQPREMQPQCIEFIHQPGVIKQVALQTGKGKALSVHEPVLTPKGWVPIGNLKVNDKVCAPDGTATHVTGVYPQGEVLLFNVTFKDGRVVKACKDHLWKVYCDSDVSGTTWRIVTTEELIRLINVPNTQVYIPLMQPWSGIESELKIDPYSLGMELGDDALVDFYQSPKDYLDATEENRWKLLSGLLDVAGQVIDDHIEYMTSSQALAKDVQYLVRSLGGMCSIAEKVSGYLLNIYFDKPTRLFTLANLRDCFSKNQQDVELKLQVQSIEPHGIGEAVCISVDHSDRLFITRDFTVTHNTFTALYALAKLNVRMAIVVKKGYIHRWFSDLLGEDSLLRLEPHELLVVRGLSHLSEIITQAAAGEFDENVKVIMISTNVMDAYYNHYDDNDGDMSAFGNVPPEALWALLGVGGRILDEIHQLLHMNFRMDLYTHITKAIYLSATLIPSTPLIDLIYKTMFPPETRAKVGEYDKYINMTCLFYGLISEKVRWTRFGSNDYSQSAFEESIMKQKKVCNGYIGWLVELANRYFVSLPDRDEPQKLVIFCGTIEFCTMVVDALLKDFPNIDSRRFTSYDAYENVTDAQIIVTTHGSLGTAHDVPNLRVVIKAIGMGKHDANLQNVGRLRKLKNYPDITPEYVYLTCRDIPQHMKYHKTMEELFIPRVLKYRNLETDFKL